MGKISKQKIGESNWKRDGETYKRNGESGGKQKKVIDKKNEQ